MKPAIQAANYRRGPIAALIFYTLIILLIPVILVGYLLWISKLFMARKSGVSGTAQGRAFICALVSA